MNDRNILFVIIFLVLIGSYVVIVTPKVLGNNDNEYMILFTPLRLDNGDITKESLGFESVLVGLVLDQKDTVTWVNQDTYPFTINGKEGSWTTGEINPGKSGSVKFNATGIYEFTSDADYAKMNGIIAVVESSEITYDNIEQRMKTTQKILEKLGSTQVDLKNVFSDINRKIVIVSLSEDKFTDETPAAHYQEKLQDWIPFETRIVIAMNSDSDSEYSGFTGVSYEIEWIKFHNNDVMFAGKQFHALPLTDSIETLGNKQIMHKFHGINFQFYEKQSDDKSNLDEITRVKMTFPDGKEEDIFVQPPMKYRYTEDKEKLHPYFSSTSNHDLPIRPIILSIDDDDSNNDEIYPTYILIHKKDLSLTEQHMLGITPAHMGCNSDLGRYIKTNGDFVCVKDSTFFKILNRGYFDTKKINGFDVNYYSDTISIQDMYLDDDDNSLSVNIEKNNARFHDLLTISIPNELLHPRYYDEMMNEQRFGLLFDEKLSEDDIYAWERTQTPSHRILGLMIDNATSIVKIIGDKIPTKS